MSEQDNLNEQKSGSSYGGAGIDFSGVSALANTDFVPEKRSKAFLNGLLESLLKFLLFLFGILLDVLKSLWAIISGIFIGIYRIALNVGRYFRKNHRKFREMDGWGKASFFLQGIGQIKYGQVGQGVVFMAVEVAFIVFLAVAGVTNVLNLFALDAVARQSHTRLILGILAIIIIVAYWVVWQLGVNSTYDTYQILHNFDFRNARENSLKVLLDAPKYADGDTPLERMGHMRVYKLMRTKYGFNFLSARYISYIDFKRLPERGPNPWVAFKTAATNAFFRRYDVWRRKVKAGKWSSVFAAYLTWQPIKPKQKYGLSVLRNEVETGLLIFHHTYDKYNDYHSVLRDTNACIKVLSDPEMVMKCVYAEDPVSVRGGIKPLAHGSRPKAKVIMPRIIGYFEVSFDVGKKLAKFVAKALAQGEEGAKKLIIQERDNLQQKADIFVYENVEKAQKQAEGVKKAYADFDRLSTVVKTGKKNFLAELKNVYEVDAHYGRMIFRDYQVALKMTGGVESVAKENLALRGENFVEVETLIKTYAYHGQPTTFKKQAKQFTNEKFAVTVLALPTLGALLTCILPLLFSIVIAFTNWDSSHTAYRFTWNMEAWQQVFGLSSTGGDFANAFGALLLWTLIWAFFATFTNYVFGIILALLINKKGIKGKGFYRTAFVVTIAIPQFITLLTMNLLLSDTGPINSMLDNAGLAMIPFLGEVQSGTPAFDVSAGDYFFIKFMIVVINMWVGIPYTMLSTSGILMNIPEDLYESASIDGANPWTQFWKITMPYVIFVTGPSLLTTFIGNINNFNVIFFLSGGGPTKMDSLGNSGAGHTDLLITWLYKLTANRTNPEYAMGSVIGIMMFAVCAFFSLIMYKRMGSVQNEEEFQ